MSLPRNVLQSTLERIANTALQVLSADTVDLYEFDASSEEFRLPPVMVGKRRFPKLVPAQVFPDDVVVTIARSKQKIYAPDAQGHHVLAGPWESPRRGRPEDRFVVRELIVSSAGVPLVEGEEVFGVLFVGYRRSREFDDELQSQIENFAGFAATAIQNARLLEQGRMQRRQAEILGELVGILTSAVGLPEVAEQVLTGLGGLVEYRKATIQLLHGDTRSLLAFRGFEPNAVDQCLLKPISEDELVSRIVASQQLLILPHPQIDLGWEVRDQTKDVRSWVGIPLVYANQTIGLLTMDHDEPGYYTEALRDILDTFGNYAAAAIHKAQLLHDSQNRSRDLEILSEIGELISTKLDTEQLYRTIISEVVDKLNCSHCTLFLAQPAGGELLLVPQKTYGQFSEQIMQRRFRLGEGVAGWVLQHGQSAVVHDTRRDNRFSQATYDQGGPRSMLVVPIKVGTRTIGVLSADQDAYGWFSDEDRRLMEALALQAGVAIERALGIRLLHEIGERITSAQNVDDILQEIVEGAIQLTAATSGVIYLIGTDKKSITASYASPPYFQHPKPRLDQETGVTHQVIESGKILAFPDINQDAGINPELERVRAMIALPLRVEEDVVGVLYLNDARPHSFSETETVLLSTLTGLGATALVNAHRFHELQKRASQLEDLHQITSTLLDEPADPDKVIDRIIEGLGQAFPGASCFVRLYDRQTDTFTPLRASGPHDSLKDVEPRLDGTSRWIVDTNRPRYLTGGELVNPPDAGPPVRDEVRDQGIQTTAYLPLSIRDDVIGVLYLDLDVPYRFSDDDRRILELFADSAALAIQNVRLHQQRITDISALQETTKAILTASEIEIAQLIAERAQEISGADYSGIWRVEAGKLVLHFMHPLTPAAAEAPPPKELPLNENSINGWAAIHKEPYNSPDVGKDIHYHAWLPEVRSSAAVPLLVDSSVLGTLSVESTKAHAFSEHQFGMLRTLADQVAIAIRVAELYKDLQRKNKQLGVLTRIYELIMRVGIGSINEILDLVHSEMSTVINLADSQVQIAFWDNETVTFPLAVETEGGQIIDRIRWGIREEPYRGAGEHIEVPQFQMRFSGERYGLTEHVIQTKEHLLLLDEFQRPQCPGDSTGSDSFLIQLPIGVDTTERAAKKAVTVWRRFGRRDRPTNSWLGVPMVVQDQVIGIISIQSLGQEPPVDPDQLETLQSVANQTAVAIVNARLFQRLQEEQRQREAAARIAALNEASAEYIHRMNNAAGTVPIRVGQIRELLDPMDPNHGMISRYLDRIEQDAERILETARAIGGTVNVDKDSLEASDLNLLLTTALAHVECPPGLDIELDMTVDLPEVRVLSSDMVSVLENIIRNGIEAEPHHGPMNMRSYQLHRTGKEMVAVDISDRGCGIAQENLERVFEIGWSTKPGSMGFALYRAKNLIESWGGMIGIRSELNKGSTFTIQLPAFREEMV